RYYPCRKQWFYTKTAAFRPAGSARSHTRPKNFLPVNLITRVIIPAENNGFIQKRRPFDRRFCIGEFS
ncbi:MAG TPA: hypothetical protein PLT14_10150, partial [Oscillospiraceae bacterium]|nr:hypothetical protein [Oscillospiraceae bacterium]